MKDLDTTIESAATEFEKGIRLLDEDKPEKALRSFEKAFKVDRSNPDYMSYYGLMKATRGGQIGLGLELCTRAVKKDCFKSEYYLNLGRVFLAAGNRKSAIQVFRKGLKFEPGNQQIKKELARLGLRSNPVIPSLERSNLLNKFLGILLRKRPSGGARRG